MPGCVFFAAHACRDWFHARYIGAAAEGRWLATHACVAWSSNTWCLRHVLSSKRVVEGQLLASIG